MPPPDPVVAVPAGRPSSRVAARFARGYGFGDPRAFALFVHYFKPYRRMLLGYAVGASLVSMLLLPVIWLVRRAFDHAIPAGDVTQLCRIGAAIVGVRMLGTLLSLSLRRTIVAIIKRAVTRLREDLLAHVYLAPRDQLSRADLDRLQSRIVQETERVDVMSNALLSGVIPALFSSFGLAAMLLWFSPVLVLLAVLLLPVAWLAASCTSRFVSRDVQRFQGAFESYNKGMSFVLRQMDLTRVQACETEEIARQKESIERLRASGEKMSWSFAVHGQVQATVTGLLGIVLLVVGGIEVARGALTVGAFLAFYFGAGMLNGFVTTVLRGTADVIGGSVSLMKLAEVFDSGAPPAYRGRQPLQFRGGFELREVTFTYGRDPVLRAASLAIAPGAHVALIGANGAGKTTVLNMLLGLTAPLAGEVLADGRPYRELDLRGLRRQIGVVMQRSSLFFGTIRSNLEYGNEAVSEAELVAAARLAGVDDFVQALPEGYDTPTGEGGVMLSGGESQRLAIARALLRKPRALILDEPTNHLDVAAVRTLLAALRAMPSAPTIVVVSHDERLMDFADEIWRIADGRVCREAGGRTPPAPPAADVAAQAAAGAPNPHPLPLSSRLATAG
jgi:ABC-type multidrug transport system fused ATPase/permease subunit